MIDHTTDSTRTSRPGDLARLGDDLERAFARDLVATPRAPCRSAWRRKAVIVPATLALGTLGAGVAAAAGLFSDDQVQVALTRNLVFGDVTATCTTSDSVTFDCRTSAPPPGDPTLSTPDPGSGKMAPVGPDDYRGAGYEFVVDDHVAGGCRGQDHAGRHWICYSGQAAVDRAIISQDFLGQYVPPGVRSVG